MHFVSDTQFLKSDVRSTDFWPETMEQKKKSDDNLIHFGSLDEFGAPTVFERKAKQDQSAWICI